MFEASVDGQPYDTERWGQYFRPAGVAAPAGGSVSTAAADENASAPAATASPAPAARSVAAETPAWEDDEPAAATAPVAKPAASQKAEDILAMIRNRQQK